MAAFDRMLRVCATLVLAAVTQPVAAAEPGKASPAKTSAPASERRADVDAGVVLARLHHVAEREIALGLLAQVAAFRPATMRFATDLETDFRELDRRIVAIADDRGTGAERLRQVYAEDNTIALEDQAEDLDHLSMARGGDFDRQFWVTLARDQHAASTLLAATVGTVPSLGPLVSETARLLDRYIRKALAAQTGRDRPATR